MMSPASKKIMIVDDEPNIVLALKFLMEDEGYDVHYCYDGETAVENVMKVTPDLTAIIFLTAKGASKDKIEGYDSGAETYIVKPFDNDEIVAKVREVLSV